MMRRASDKSFFFLNDTAPTEIYPLSLHDALPISLPVGSQGQSPAWLRGQYLGNVMGHCAECHTPRGMFGQMQTDRWLQGGTLSLFTAPGITAEALAARGWTREGMAQFLQTGFSAHGSAFDEMHEVIANSTRYLTAEDMTALSTFLLGDNPPAL